MSRGEEKRDELRRVVLAILATGTSLTSVIGMFADVLREAGYGEAQENKIRCGVEGCRLPPDHDGLHAFGNNVP